ncbi:MAG: isocitrate lyase/phosphoenolpyruvate mutase family protein [Acidobacteriota bacterium]
MVRYGRICAARAVLPEAYLLVDIDDGHCDTEVACHVVRLLESIGASGVIIEDQQRPRKYGHYDDKKIMERNKFLVKLNSVLTTRRDLFIVAHTDVDEPAEMIRKAIAFNKAGAEAILVEAIKSITLLATLKREVSCPILYN